MKRMLEFTRDVFRDGACVHAKGSRVEATEATARHVRRGEAVEVEAEDAKKPPAKGKATKAKK